MMRWVYILPRDMMRIILRVQVRDGKSYSNSNASKRWCNVEILNQERVFWRRAPSSSVRIIFLRVCLCRQQNSSTMANFEGGHSSESLIRNITAREAERKSIGCVLMVADTSADDDRQATLDCGARDEVRWCMMGKGMKRRPGGGKGQGLRTKKAR